MKFTILRIMVAVALVAPFVMALREDAEGSMPLGASIMAACIMVLTWKFYVDAIARWEVGSSRWRRVLVAELSLLAAFLVIVSADLAFVVAYELYVTMQYYWPRRSHVRHDLRIHGLGLVGGLVAASCMVALARSVLWAMTRRRPSSPRPEPDEPHETKG